MLDFDPTKGIKISDESETRAKVQAEWINAFKADNLPPLDVSDTSPVGQIIDSQSAAIANKDRELLYLASQFNPEIAEGIFQDALAKIYFIERKLAEPTLVECTCIGLAGTVIPAGSFVKTNTDIKLSSVNESVIPEGGSVSVTFRTVDTGAIYINKNTVTDILTVIDGWDTVHNYTAGVTGRDTETRVAFEARRKESIAKNSHGSLAAIVGSLWSVDNVVAVKAFENNTRNIKTFWGVEVEPFGILLSIYGGADYDIAKTIYNKKNEGSTTSGNTKIRHIATDYNNAIYDYNILRPTMLPFFIKVSIKRYQTMPINIEGLIKNAILDNFEARTNDSNLMRIIMAQVVYASRFYPSVVDIVKQNLVAIKISIDGANYLDEVTVNADEMPTLSISDIEVEIL